MQPVGSVSVTNSAVIVRLLCGNSAVRTRKIVGDTNVVHAISGAKVRKRK